MSLKLANNATSLLAALIDPVATALQVATADAGKFPAIAAGAGDWFPVVVVDASANREIMRCTARSGVTLTVTRAQEGTTALTFQPGARVDLRLTTQAINELIADATLLTTGIISDSVLPVRLRPDPQTTTDANLVTITGRYVTTVATLNIPSPAEVGYLWADVLDTTAQYQEWQDVDSTKRWARRRFGSVWAAWYRLYIDENKVPPGSMIDFAGVSAPSGWLLCYGQAALRTTYPDLDTAIYCGDAANPTATFGYRCTSSSTPTTTRSTTGQYFVIPDMRGRVAAGQDDMGGTSANRLTAQSGGVNGDSLSAVGGLETHVITDAQMPVHNHAGSAANGGAHTHNTTIRAGQSGSAGLSAGNSSDGGYISTDAGGSLHTHAITIGNAGGDAAHNNVQPTIIVNKIIKT